MLDNISLATIIFFIIGFLLSITGLLIVPRNRKPSAGMAWLLVIFLLPYVGWILFLLLGTNKLPKKRRDSQTVLDYIIDKRVAALKDEMIDIVPTKYQSVARLATSLGRMPPLPGQSESFMTDYGKTIDAIVKDIDAARTSVYVEYYILTLDRTTTPVFTALKTAVDRGVEVRVLFDWWGVQKFKGYKPMVKFLQLHHIPYHAMLPLKISFRDYLRPDLRNHRKLLVIDQKLGYVGSQNLIARSYNRKDGIVYDELVVRLKGVVVKELSALFAYDWSIESDEPLSHALSDELQLPAVEDTSLLQILPSGPSYHDQNNLKVFTFAINRAEHDIFIANPYFVPSEDLLVAIVSAVKRGVRVRMINSEAIDQWMVGHAQRSYYDEILEAGVELYLYKKPALLHSKFLVIDEEMAIVGSSNLDIRSFELNQELSLIIYSKAETKRLLAIRDLYLERSYKLDLEKWRKRKIRRQLFDSVARLTSNIQ